MTLVTVVISTVLQKIKYFSQQKKNITVIAKVSCNPLLKLLNTYTVNLVVRSGKSEGQ